MVPDMISGQVTLPSGGFSGRKILVTGASGFIGSHLCQRLHAAGAEVHAISRRSRATEENGLHWWRGDVSELATVQQVLTATKPDTIFHLASHVVGARDLDVVGPTFRSNLMSTVNLLTVANEIGCRRIILTGSLEEPELGNPRGVPSSPYAAAKWAGNAYARMFHALYELPVVILRVFMVYGPAQQDLRKLIPYVILSLLRGQAPQLTTGQREIDWIYVEDVVSGLVAASQAANVEGSTIDLGSGELISIRTVVEHLVHFINPHIEPVFGAVRDRPFEQERVADVKTAHMMLEWKAATPLEEGLKRTISWYERRLEEGTV